MQPTLADILSEACQRPSIRSPLLRSLGGVLACVLTIGALSSSPPPIAIENAAAFTETSATVAIPPAEDAAWDGMVAPIPEMVMLEPEAAEMTVSAEDAVPPAEKALPPEHVTEHLIVKDGDSFTTLLSRGGAEPREAHAMIEELRKVCNLRNLRIGQKLELEKTFDPIRDGYQISALSFSPSRDEIVTLRRESDFAFKAKKETIVFTRGLELASGSIRSSVLEAIAAARVPYSLALQMIHAYSYDIDFQRQIHPGDRFTLLYERFYRPDGSHSHNGRIVYASLDLQGAAHSLYYFARKGRPGEYYDEKGHSVRKELLRTPISGARISSGFGMRMHPVLGYSKMHRGMDFAAATGTPIYAAGNGVVDYVGKKGAYGRYVRIRHNNAYSTAYAHMSRFRKGMHRGQKVRQGETIGYVGNSGRSTGPHLHYEVLKHGAQINPKQYVASSNHNLAGRELARFRSFTAEMQQIAANGGQPVHLAMADK